MTVVFVQPFSFASPGGGPRIFRALAAAAPLPIVSVASSVAPPSRDAADSSSEHVHELHLPPRPHFGRLDSTRLYRALNGIDLVLQSQYERRLERICRQRDASAIHGLAHAPDFWPALRVAHRLKLPYFLTVHDDLRYTMAGNLGAGIAERRLGEAWRQATHRFVISREMGTEYSRRYGRATFTVVTDGIDSVADAQLPPADSFRVYFGGLFHLVYRPNLRALLDALRMLSGESAQRAVAFTGRCGSIADFEPPADLEFRVLPYGPAATMRDDMHAADFLYLPLPFGKDGDNFSRYSMSAKMVTYLGSGRPIIYHGPPDAAAGSLLARHGACIAIHTLEAQSIAATLLAANERLATIVANARDLAQSEFMLADHQQRFWREVEPAARAAIAA